MPAAFICPTAPRLGSERAFKDYGINTGSDSCCPERENNRLEHEGVGFMNSSVAVSDIKDGTSNTFLFLELSHNWVNQNNLPTNHFLFVSHNSDGMVMFQRPINAPNAGRGRDARSWHVGGLQATLADGSVRFLSENMDFDLYEALGTRNGRETLGEF